MDTIIQDIRYGLRQLAKYPAFSAVAILTLALGVGANTAVFSVVRALLIRPLPFPESERLVRLYDANQEHSEFRGVFSPTDLDDVKRSQTVYQDLAAFEFFLGNTGGTLIGAGEPHYIPS
ncbi:MAG TPA: hypothetical protein VG498_03050 [Terriglobales bacterium]|nr:hypothetical protein [Terriglobales bacterium]